MRSELAVVVELPTYNRGLRPGGSPFRIDFAPPGWSAVDPAVVRAAPPTRADRSHGSAQQIFPITTFGLIEGRTTSGIDVPHLHKVVNRLSDGASLIDDA
jgi:hypothetical protein